MHKENKVVADYWFEHYRKPFEHYQIGHCTLCGNSGVIDTRGMKTAAGVEIGCLNHCICPNGQVLRHHDPEALTIRTRTR